MENEAIYSKVLRAGRRTYFFDVRETKAGEHFITITESKKFTNDDGSFHFKKHKIYLYKEDMTEFQELLTESLQFIDKSNKRDVKEATIETDEPLNNGTSQFTDVDFDDI